MYVCKWKNEFNLVTENKLKKLRFSDRIEQAVSGSVDWTQEMFHKHETRPANCEFKPQLSKF